ncbi:COR domain-containing protein [Methylomonas montana]|uniref:COR domain-containing protein n=1 Tax=Methylomonas montana TaxID=3058963 RepID=UPI002658D22D|nr:COR domain-containing protein [Methylomonas montana]WKJ90574.1 COR domain-containing protein [Methylomonas montana]
MMFDRNQFRVEIQARLKELPIQKRVAFAVRAAMRVLPLLSVPNKTAWFAALTGSNDQSFRYWKANEKDRHLLSILRCYGMAIEFALTEKYSDAIADIGDAGTNFGLVGASHAADAAKAAAYVAKADIAAAVASAADSAARTAYYPVNTHKTKTANNEPSDKLVEAFFTLFSNRDYSSNSAVTAVESVYAAKVAQDATTLAIRQDLAALTKITANALLEQPLWPESIPEDWMRLLEQFKADVSTLNAGFEVWLDWYDDIVKGHYIDIELRKQWNNIPDELKLQGAKKVNAYLKNLGNTNASTPLNRVRAIFIGYGESGKTSLIRALHGEDVIQGKETMTAGIDIRDWLVPDTNIQAHFWDFGGQVVFHSTHKFFLRSSCVYIIVINARADINSSEQAEYWLDHVKVFGNSAPVILVANKADEAIIHLQMENLTRHYPNIKGFYPVSCTEAKTAHRHEFETFKQALSVQLQAVGIHQMLFTPEQGGVLQELQQNALTNAFMGENEFQQLCDKYQVSDQGELNRDWLVDIFDKLGVMLHFDELKTFHNAYLLNPRWLTHGVYTLMNAKQSRINEADMVRILASSRVEDEYQHLLNYPADKCLFISRAMQRFKLCYPLSNNEMIIPALLADELSSYPAELKNKDILSFEFDFSSFLPRNLIGEFIVSRHHEIKDNLLSQRGGIFKSRSLKAEALVEANYHRRLIVIQVYGRDAKEYLTVLYDAMKRIFSDLALDFREWVDLPHSSLIDTAKPSLEFRTEKAPYQQLLAFARKGEREYIAESGLSYDLGKVLGLILSKEGQLKAGISIFGDYYAGDKKVSETKISINGNTVHGSIIAAEKIENSFNSLDESKSNKEVTMLLAHLLREIQELNNKVPASQSLEDLGRDAEALVVEAQREAPRHNRLSISLEGIKEAALVIGEIAKPIWEVAEKLSPLLLGI